MHQSSEPPGAHGGLAAVSADGHRVGPQRDPAVRPASAPAHEQDPVADRGADASAVGRLATTVERLRQELQRAHADAAGRALVEMAMGMLIERLGCSPAEAAVQLSDLAAQADVSVLELAADLVNQAAEDRISAIARDFVRSSAEPAADSAALRLRCAEAHALAGGDTGAAARSMLDQALRPLGAVAVAIWAAHPDQSLSLAGSAGFSPQEATRWRHVPPGVPTPARRALDERAAVGYTTLADAALPSIGQHDVGGGRLAVPAGIGGRLTGVLEICWPDRLPALSQSLERQFEALAELAAATLETWSDLGGTEQDAPDAHLEDLRRLVDGLSDPCLILQMAPDSAEMPLEFTIRYVNPAFVDFAGRPAGAIVGAGLLEAYPLAAEAGGLMEKVEHVFVTGEPFRATNMKLTAMVEGVPLSARARVSISRHGDSVAVVWRLDDGTPRVARLLQHAQRLGRIGGFEENLQTGQIAWNETVYELHGLSPTAQPIPLDQLADHVHPDDQHNIGRFLRRLLHHERPASTAFRLQRPDGVARHIRIVAEPVRDPDAGLRIVRGAYQDISAQHWTEVALAATRDQLIQTELQAAEGNRLVLQLQHAIMPPARGTFSLHDLQVAVRYRPAEKEHLVGGDWYDTLTLPSGEVLLCVGDVAGHGIDAATGMVALRNALRGLAATGAGPAQLLTWLNSITHQLTENLTATAACGLYDPVTRRLRWARAGHLPPVLLREGRATTLPQLGGILLGVLEQAEYDEEEVHLQPGDVLVMYTDGLIERRDQGLQTSLANLVALTEKAESESGERPNSLEARLDHLLRYSGSDTDDDTCLVGVLVQEPERG